MGAKQKEENLTFWQKYKFYFIGCIGAFLLIGSMSVQNVVLSYQVGDGERYTAKLDYSAYGICLRCQGTTENSRSIVEKEIFFLKNKEDSVANAASALKEMAGEGGEFKVLVGGILSRDEKKMVDFLESLGYEAAPMQ